MSKNKHVNLQLKYCTLLPTFVCLNTWSLFLDISLCALLISRYSYFGLSDVDKRVRKQNISMIAGESFLTSTVDISMAVVTE